jgi:VWFA-related protein
LRLDFCRAALGFILCALAARFIFAQGATRENQPPQLTIYGRTVVEDVVVTDKSGRPVPGLRKEDFQVFENGKPQAITFFEPNLTAMEPAAEPSIPPPNTFTNAPVDNAHAVTNILLLDALDSWPEDEMYAHVQMVKYLASLPPHLRIGIFTLTPEKLNLIWPINQDSSALREAVVKFTSSHSAKASTTAAQQQALLSTLSDTRQAAQAVENSRLAESAFALQNFLKHGTGVIQQHNHGAMEALEALARYLAGIPGRKNLFWIVGNFPHCEPIEACDRTINALAEAGVSVYPIDAHGVDVDMGLSPDPDFHQAARRFADSESWADDTGGKAYHVNDMSREIADAVDHGSHYYTLAYVPSDRKEEGRERTVEVKVRGSYSISYRRHYLERTRKEIKTASSEPARNPLLPLMGHGLPNSSGIPYRLKVVPAAVQPGPETKRAGQNAQLTGNLTRYDVEFQFQPGVLSSSPSADNAIQKSLQVALVVYGQDFKPLNWEIREIHLEPEQWAAERKNGIALHLEIDAPAGDVYLRTGVYDSASRKVGTLEIPLSAVVPMRKNEP